METANSEGGHDIDGLGDEDISPSKKIEDKDEEIDLTILQTEPEDILKEIEKEKQAEIQKIQKNQVA